MDDAVDESTDASAAGRRTQRILGWTSFFQDLGSKMIVPILPLFLTTTLGAPPVAVGLVDGAGEAVASVSASWAGRVAARRRAMPLVRAGYALSSAAKGLLALAGGWVAVLALRTVDRLGKGVRDAPRDAVLAATAADGRHGRAFGFQQAMDKAGRFLGPLVGLAAFELAGQRYRPVFLVALVPCAFSVLLLFRLRSDATAPDAPAERIVRLTGDERRRLARAVGPSLLAALLRVPEALVVLRLDALGASTGEVLVSYSVLRALNAVAACPAGALADRLDPRGLVGFGTACVLAVNAVAWLGGSTAALVAFPLLGVADACTRSPLKRLVVSVAPEGRRAAVLGDLAAVKGLGALALGLVAGAAWGDDGSAVLAVATGASFLAVLVLMASPRFEVRPRR